MSYHIPSDEQIKDALEKVLKKFRTVQSQNKSKELVIKELNTKKKRVKNLTIWGGEVTIEFRCNKCGYWTGKKKRIPTRYVFHLKKKKA